MAPNSPHKTMSVTGAILAGGLSTRMGRDKATMPLHDGRTMIEHVIEAVGAVCDQVVVLGPSTVAPGLVSIADLRPQCGPLGGIEALLASGIASQYLVCPCDVPLVTPSLLKRLMEPCEALASVFRIEGNSNDQVESLPARISAAALPVVKQLLDADQRSVWQLMERIHPAVVTITREQARQLHNVNSIEDVAIDS